MIRLGRLLRDYGDAIEADLSDRFINLWSDLGTARLPWPRFRAIVDHLGPTSALHRERDPDSYGWTTDSYLLATLVNVIGFANKLKEPLIVTPAEKAEKAAKTARTRRRAREYQDRRKG